MIIPVLLLALGLFTVTFAVNVQAPLYDVYAAQSSVGATAVTLAFAAYVAGLMPTLVLLGGLSDRIGRRGPVALALVLGTVATALLVQAPGWENLVIAGFLLGVGAGLATTAGMAYMAEIMGADQTRNAALIVTSATSLGFGGGALATGISLGIQGPTLLPVSYIALFVAAPLLAVITLGLPQSDQRRTGPLVRLPVFPSGTWVFGVALALAWSTTGMTIAIVPLQLTANGLGGWTGLVIFLAIFVGFLSQPLARRMSNDRALVIGFVLVPLGFLVVLVGVWLKSLVLVLIGTCITSAASYGFTYLASLTEVALRAPGDRARATAGLFVYAYCGFSFPVIASGALADLLGLLPAMVVFESVQVAVTVAVFILWTRQSAPSGTAPRTHDIDSTRNTPIRYHSR
jgi:MFS family permease